jgi:hypothetical protein
VEPHGLHTGGGDVTALGVSASEVGCVRCNSNSLCLLSWFCPRPPPWRLGSAGAVGGGPGMAFPPIATLDGRTSYRVVACCAQCFPGKLSAHGQFSRLKSGCPPYLFRWKLHMNRVCPMRPHPQHSGVSPAGVGGCVMNRAPVRACAMATGWELLLP